MGSLPTIKGRIREGHHVRELLLRGLTLTQASDELGIDRSRAKESLHYHNWLRREYGAAYPEPDGPVAFYNFERFGAKETRGRA